MSNSEGYKDPTADKAIHSVYHTNGKLDYTKFKSYDELIEYTMSSNKSIKTRTQAERYIREHMPKESYFQKKIMNWLMKNFPNAGVWKEAAGPYSRHGLPDITCIIKGLYYGFEVKRPFIGKLSEIQKDTIDWINESGGRAYVVTSEKEVAEILKDELKEAQRANNASKLNTEQPILNKRD